MDNISVETNDNQQEIQRVPLKSKLAYGVGHVLNDVCASMWFTYLLVYFHLVLGFSPAYAGVVLLIGQVADAVATPFVGLHSDKNDDFWLCRYGRRKTWHLMGTICVVATFPFIFSHCIGCSPRTHQWAQLIYYAAFVIIFQFGWASVQISHLSLIPDLTPSDLERTALTAISFTVFSNVLVYCVTWAVLHITSESPTDKIGPNDAYKFQEIVLIGMSIGVLSSIIFHIFVRENNSRDALTGVSQEESQRELQTPFSIFKDPELYQVACIYMPTRLFVNLTQTYIPLYLHETLQMPATSLAIIPLIMYLSSFKASLAINYINAKLGRKGSYLIGAVMGLGACTWIFFGKGEQFVSLFIYPVSLLLGSGGSMMIVTSLAITADYIGHSTENGAFVYGVMSFTDKLSNGLAVMIIQYMRCTTDCTDYYKQILSFVCGGAAVFGLIMTLSRNTCGNSVVRATADYSNLESEETEENPINASA
ncbi:hypothetical protein TSAR_000932 [Trichomalopsis sarcophagae]|uniref:Major facilitator superfamily (MFS) profile domain-containing protein n=1 Tax=Trichomalopsis sarcophagae TaxID=543379 RepID=A0A232ERE3_9HYME|nr:hypothetical protein TSAR_000932 [Trichomalopsis sarcophagae]